MVKLANLLKTLALFILRFSKKFNPHYDYLLISTEEIVYSDKDYIGLITELSYNDELYTALLDKIAADGHNDIVDYLPSNNTVQNNTNLLIKASEVYNGRGKKNWVGRL